MAITLPFDNQAWPQFRLLVRNRWLAQAGAPQTSGTGAWEVLAVDGQPGKTGGFYLLDYDRACLPQIGLARFGVHFGVVNGRVLHASSGSAASAAAGTAWSSSTDTLTIPRMTGWEVRIQGAPASVQGATPAWRTVWAGTIETEEDSGWAGAGIPAGDRIYHCADSLFRLSRWILDRHGYAATDPVTGSAFVGSLRGHPGYNIGRSHDGRTQGNRWNGSETWIPDAGGTASYHTLPGSTTATTWTDQLAIEHAQASTRRPNEPLFPFSGNVDRLQAVSSWEIRSGETCLDFLTRVLKRERGNGLAFLDWNDDSASPDGPLTVMLKVLPQNAADITYTDPTSLATVTIAGSYTAGSNAGNVDLIGDHRVVDGSLRFGDKEQYRLNALETVGEPIEAMVTVGFTDGPSGTTPNIEGVSLKRRWSASEQTTFRARAQTLRADERWRPVYQLYGLPVTWGFVAGDGNNAWTYRCDYRCGGDDTPISGVTYNGQIIGDTILQGGTQEATSLLMTTLLDDLPMYEGWDYSAVTPVRWDAGNEASNCVRRPILKLLRISTPTGGKYVKLESVLEQMQLRIDGHDLWLTDSRGTGNGVRPISDTTLQSLGATYSNTNLCFTVALRLPHRVRLYSGLPPDDPGCTRKATIYHPDHHLWLAHPGAIWDIDGSAGSEIVGRTPRRAACKGTPDAPGILRDDRSALARLHYLAWNWYGTRRRTVTWALRCCGSLGTYDAFQGTEIPTDGSAPSSFTYPTLGKTIDQLSANGETHVVNTPVTRIAYDNVTGITTWSTDWNELELEP